MKILYETVFGSHLYGTSTPTSDHDYKGVYVPPTAEILLPKIPDVKTFNTGPKYAKNSSDDVDRELYSVHKFFDMLIKGDMNAYEMLFAPLNESATEDWRYIVSVRDLMLSRKCRGFVGYVQRQAATYGVRGDRYNECAATIQFLVQQMRSTAHDKKLETALDMELRTKAFCEDKKHTSFEYITNSGKELFHLVCCDRKVPLTTKFSDAISVYQRVIENYGNRAIAAATNEGIDWKAVSHAVRIGQQAVELLDTGVITFPRPNAERLRSIKRGEAVYSEIAQELDDLLHRVQELSEWSHLPDEPDVKFMYQLREDLYESQVQR